MVHYLNMGRGANNHLIPGPAVRHRDSVFTGQERIDQLLNDFIKQNPELYNGLYLEMLRSSEYAIGECSTVSLLFEQFSKDYYPDIIIRDVKQLPNNPDDWGYTDRLEEGLDDHVATVLEVQGHAFAIDWSAAQYGYEDFPLVQEWNEFTGPGLRQK